jgi:hypothetical protein
MRALTNRQIEEISASLQHAGINYSHLFEDLLDHICCDIESLMLQNVDYKKAYKIVFNKIGFNGLEKIQETTIFYVKLNLMMMKKTMYVLAILGTGSLSTGLFFKLMHWPGASILYSLGFLIVLLGFLPVTLYSVKKEMAASFFSKKFLIYFTGFLCLFETGLAILFINMHWPGGHKLALISWILILFVFFPILFYQVAISERNKGVNLILSTFAFFFVCISIVSTYNSHTNPINTAEYYELLNEVNYYKTQLSTNSSSMDPITSVRFQAIDNIGANIENLIKKKQAEILNGEESIYTMSRHFLHKASIQNDWEIYFIPLKKLLNEYSAEAQKLCDNTALKQLIILKLSTEPLDPQKFGHMFWEKRNFYGPNENVSTITSLERILRNVYQVKKELIVNLAPLKSPE